MSSINLHHRTTTGGMLGAIVLAAGASSRMGQPKQLLKYRGQTLLRRICEAAIEAECAPIVVVLGAHAQQIAAELDHLAVDATINPNWQSGIGSSIRAGVQRMIELSPILDATLILLCDQPVVDASVIARLVQMYRESGKGVCAASFAQTLGPPVVVSRRFLEMLLRLPDDRGAKQLWLEHPEELCRFECAEGEIDLDTPEDLRRLAE
jgi:molybdenum cofactor cytidylyltransferase